MGRVTKGAQMTNLRVNLWRDLGGRSALALLICVLGLTSVAHAAPRQQTIDVSQVQVLADPSAIATLDQILAQRAQFTDLDLTTPNFGFTPSAYWLRIPVQNQTDAPQEFYLDIKNAVLDYVTLYVVSQGLLQETVHSGDKLPARQRPYPATTLVLPFHLAPGTSAELYVQVKSDGEPLLVPFAVLEGKALQSSITFAWMLHSLFLGVFGALFIYNLFVLSLLRSRLHLYYVLFLPITYLAIAGGSGFGPAALYPDNTWLGNEGTVVFSGISLLMNILILRELLQIQTNRRLERWLKIFIIGAIIIGISPFLWSWRFAYSLIMVAIFLYPAFCSIISVIAWRHKQTEARFYLMGQICLWCSTIIIGLLGANILPYHLLLFQSPTIGVAVSTLLLSFALTDRIRILQRARLQAEEQARQNLEIRSEELERLVAERTAEIKTLHGILPICANCKKIRDEEGAWQGLETYISQHTDAQFSHGICTDCMKTLYPEVYRRRQQRSQTG